MTSTGYGYRKTYIMGEHDAGVDQNYWFDDSTTEALFQIGLDRGVTDSAVVQNPPVGAVELWDLYIIDQPATIHLGGGQTIELAAGNYIVSVTDHPDEAGLARVSRYTYATEAEARARMAELRQP
jgi:hypothetical protein